MTLSLQDCVKSRLLLAQRVLIGVSVVLSAGCQTMGGGAIPAAAYESFTPQSLDQRIMKEVKLRWEVREDVAQHCARSIGMGREQAYITPPLACAVWHVASNECVIVTGSPTTHVALGHEVRHCFEGHFHK